FKPGSNSTRKSDVNHAPIPKKKTINPGITNSSNKKKSPIKNQITAGVKNSCISMLVRFRFHLRQDRNKMVYIEIDYCFFDIAD
ncbi:MAG TPA: hypothetical protein DDX98_05455, partial [Bacteroidales bacterium]|nr:hypothetical protein [Bacteroidales bacterium]